MNKSDYEITNIHEAESITYSNAKFTDVLFMFRFNR